MKRVRSDYIPQKKRRILSCSDQHQQQPRQDEVISNKLLGFLNIESNSSFILNKQEVSGGICKEIVDDEGIFLPNYEQEQQIKLRAVKPNVILDSLQEKLTQCGSTKLSQDVIIKLLKVTTDLEETQFMNNNKEKHQDNPHKEIVRVLINDIAKNKNITNTFENLKHILCAKNDAK